MDFSPSVTPRLGCYSVIKLRSSDGRRTVAIVGVAFIWRGSRVSQRKAACSACSGPSPDVWPTAECSEVWSELQVLSVRTDFRYWPLVVLRRDQQSGGWHRQLLSKL